MAQSPAKCVYVLSGTDELLRRQNRQSLVHRLLGDEAAGLASFDAESELADVMDELRTVPLLASRRVVLVDPADDLVSSHADALAKYLADPTPTATLLLAVDGWKSSGELGGLVAKLGEVISCNSDASRLIQRITAAANERGKTISPAAARNLAAIVGNELALVESEVEKLSLLVLDRPEITEADVAQSAVGQTGPGQWDLVDAIRAGNTAKALTVLGQTLTSRGIEFAVLGQLAWMVRDATAKSTPQEQPRNIRNLRRLLKADLAMKSGSDPMLIMQQLVIGLSSRPRR